jgi:hypothetical protein
MGFKLDLQKILVGHPISRCVTVSPCRVLLYLGLSPLTLILTLCQVA